MRLSCLFSILFLGLSIHFSGSPTHAQIPANGVAAKDPTPKANPVRTNQSSADMQLRRLQSLVSQSPHDPHLLNNLGVHHFQMGDVEIARHYLELSVKKNGNLPRTLVNLASVYDDLGNYAKAIETAERSVALDPSFMRGRQYLCELNFYIKENEEAAKCYRELTNDFEPTPEIKTNFGVALMRVGKFDEAVPILRSAVIAAPHHLPTRNALGIAYYRTKMYRESAEVLKEAVEKAPHLDQLRFNLALAYLSLGNRSGALSQDRVLRERNSPFATTLFRILHSKHVIDARSVEMNEQ